MRTILRSSTEGAFFRDAVRDLVVVVVGILVALWLESWWQDLGDRREEQQILEDLREEFAANAEELTDRLQTWRIVRQNKIDAHQLMGGPINDETVSALEEILNRSGAGGRFFFDPRHGQLTSVINSGKLGLISNPDLRAMIADWPAAVADHDFDEDLFISHERTNIWGVERRYGANWPETNFTSRYDELMKNMEFDNSLGGSAGLLALMINEGNGILELTDDIIALIDSELEALR